MLATLDLAYFPPDFLPSLEQPILPPLMVSLTMKERMITMPTKPRGEGFLVYASTAFGWVFVMRHLKLGTIGVVYSVSMVLLLTLVGTRWFGESLNYSEMAGIALAILSLILLVRFA
jgi:multidrug transporter EmrE-like cation transporter